MFRFLVGVGIGAGLMYWLLTGEVPLRQELQSWLSSASRSYSGRVAGDR